MKKFLASACLSLLAVCLAFGKEDVDRKGAVPGRWTHDYDAAAKVAKEQGLPLMLKFTGSDWCGWCMLMEKQVFGQKDFAQWAEGRVLLVTIDQPRDPSVVPAEFKARNSMMMAQYGIRGVPTYVVLDSEGKEIGRLGASRDASVASFSKDFEKLVGTMPEKKEVPAAAADPEREKLLSAYLSVAQRKAFNEKLTPEEREEYPALLTIEKDKAAALLALQNERKEKIAAAQARIAEAQKTDPAEADRLRDESRAMLKSLDEAQALRKKEIEAEALRKTERLRELNAKLR